MAFGEIRLVPGVNVEKTPTLNQASISQSQLIRFKDGLAQKYGGWATYFPFALNGLPRDLHAWEDLNGTAHLSIGTTSRLYTVTSGSLADITPQIVQSNFSPNFTTSAGSSTVQITDSNISNVTVYDSILFNTPIAVDGLILSGLYAITQITGTHSYDITASGKAVSGVSGGGAVPTFTTTSGSSIVQVNLAAHGLTAGIGTSHQINFPIATTGNGVTIIGTYTVVSVVNAGAFTITVNNQANASSTFSMNSGNCELIYYINIAPPAAGSGYGLGGYGGGGYGLGTTGGTVQTGTPITASDYTTDNWGEILLACPSNGGIFQFDPTQGFTNAGIISTAPALNGGIFVSTALQILMAWGSTQVLGVGIERDPLLINWSNQGDYTNFTPVVTNQAGAFRIPTGSAIIAGAAVFNQNVFWTDIDMWVGNYLGPPLVFGFNKIGAGAGAISSHSVQQLRTGIYWMGPSNFYSYSGGGVTVLPCPVWDFVFQNMNTFVQKNVRAMPNTPFNEVGWLFPSTASASGECDSYVKLNITEQAWDYGSLPRSAWIDQTILGPPIGASPSGVIYQHETTNDAAGLPMAASFTTGYFYVAEGEEFAFVDQIYPDFRYGTYGVSNATIQITVNAINYGTDTPTSYGPYTVTAGSPPFISTRIRARQMSFTIASNDVGSFWRTGKIRYRYSVDGRR